MMGPAVDTTARVSSYILRCRYVSIWCWFGVQCVTRATASFTNYQFINSPITFTNRERLQLIGLKSFHQYDDGRKIFQGQFLLPIFQFTKVGINLTNLDLFASHLIPFDNSSSSNSNMKLTKLDARWQHQFI